jgi:hypothetical protein
MLDSLSLPWVEGIIVIYYIPVSLLVEEEGSSVKPVFNTLFALLKLGGIDFLFIICSDRTRFTASLYKSLYMVLVLSTVLACFIFGQPP